MRINCNYSLVQSEEDLPWNQHVFVILGPYLHFIKQRPEHSILRYLEFRHDDDDDEGDVMVMKPS